MARTDLVLVGYARVSTPDQDPGYQLRALEERGCQRIFTDRGSGRITERPQLTAALEFIRDGDVLVVWKFDRLARNLRHLIELGVELERRGCQLVSLTEAIDTGSPGGKLVFAVFGAMAEFEADLNRERTQASARAHKAAGRRWGRPSPFHDPENVRIAKAMLADRSIPRTEVARRFGLGTTALYRWFPGGDPDTFTGAARRPGGAA
ncbi:MAG: recombinase family protein [Bryobacterales bacterium]|nr:recombinase family protein [Bryobacterales bacterium]